MIADASARASGGDGSAGLSVDEYVSLVLGVIEADIRHVHVRATVSAALAAVFVTQIKLPTLRALEGPYELALGLAIVLFSLAAVAYFHYTQLLNRARLQIVKNLPAGDYENLEELVKPWEPFMRTESVKTREDPEEKNGDSPRKGRDPLDYYRAGQVFFLVGVAAAGVVLWDVLRVAPF